MLFLLLSCLGLSFSYCNGQEATLPASLPSTVASQLFYPRPEADFDARTGYPLAVLQKALQTSKQLSSFKLTATDVRMPRGRSLKLLEEGNAVDIFWSIATPERDAVLSKVDFDLYKGMFGYRLLLVKQSKKRSFESIESVDVLRERVAALGYDWPDYQILSKNGFQVQGTSSYAGLFQLLQRDRVDYLPRSVFEVWQELDHFRDNSMQVVENIALYYPISFTYYLSRKNQKLAMIIQTSLESMDRNGAFDAFFDEVWQDSLNRSDLNNKRTFHLKQ